MSQDLQADDRTIELAKRLGEARSAVKQWGDVADYLRDELLEHIKELANEAGIEPKAVVAGAGVKVASISESIRKTLDVERLKADHPEIDWDKYYKVSSSTTVRLGKLGGTGT